jgi:hypothetical protein
MDLKDKIKQLTERLDAEKPQPSVVAKEQPKPVEREYFVTLSFDKRNELMQGMLPDMVALGFELVHETEKTLRYHTSPLKKDDADELLKFMEKLKKQSSDVFYDVAFGRLPEHPVTYADVCKSGVSHVYSSKYVTGEEAKNISDHISTEKYQQSLFAFEEKLISPSFKSEFCDALIVTIKDSVDLGAMTAAFLTEDPVRSMVYEAFDFTLKLGHNAMMNFHSEHYPHMYSVDTAIDRSDTEAREVKDSLREVKVNDYHEAVGKILDERYLFCDTMKALKTFKEMKPFPKELDTEQTSDDGFSAHYFLSTDHMDRGYGNVKDEVCRIVVKTALDYIKMNKAHELHMKMNAINAGSREMGDIMIDSFKDRANVREWRTIVGNPIQAPSAPDAYVMKRFKKFKPS